MPVARDPAWSLADDAEGFYEEAACGLEIALLAEARVYEIPVAIDRAIEVGPTPMDLHVGLVHVPAGADTTSSQPAQSLGQHGCEARLPLTCGLVRELEAELQEHLGDIAEAQLVPKPGGR